MRRLTKKSRVAQEALNGVRLELPTRGSEAELFRAEGIPDLTGAVKAQVCQGPLCRESVLRSHPKVDPDPAWVRFIGFGVYSLNVEVFAYVHAADYSEFLEISEDLLLRILEAVAESGTGFAFPSQTLYLATDSVLDREKSQQARRGIAFGSRSPIRSGKIPIKI